MNKKVIIAIVTTIAVIAIICICISLSRKEEPEETRKEPKNQESATETIDEDETEKSIEDTLTKVNPDKDIVYTARSIETENNKYEYPTINLSSKDIDDINLEIKKKYGFYSLNDILGSSSGECEEIGYKYFINKKYLSLIVYTGGNSSLWTEVYTIDLEDLSKIDNIDLLDAYDLDKDKVADKALEAAFEKFEEVRLGEKDLWYVNYLIDNEYAKWKLELEDSVRKLSQIYVNENGEVCLLAELRHIGGTYSCIKTIIINISKEYEVSEFNYAQIILNPPKTTNKLVPVTQTVPVPSTPNAITTEEAIKLAQQVFGTVSNETGYEIGYSYYCWVKDESEKEYYLINMNWFNGTTWSWIGTVCIAVDGKSYKQLDMPPNNYHDGDTIFNMIEGENF